MRQALTIAIVLVGIFLLGIWGQYLLSPDQLMSNPLQALYQTLTLFALEGDWTSGKDLPWQLELTRFLAPLATFASVLILLTQGAYVQIMNSLVRVRKNHVVVAGLGRRSWHFLLSCNKQYKLVVVEIDAENPRIEEARRLGMSVIIGDMLNPKLFEEVNLQQASHLVAFTGSDGINVELAIKAKAYVQNTQGRQLLVHMHVDNTHIAERLENYPKFFSDSGSALINFFSVYDLNARILFRDYPPENFAQYFGLSQVHIALYNFGRQAEHILLEAIRICHFSNESRVKFCIFDDDAVAKGERFLASYPHLEAQCDMDFVNLPVLEIKALESIESEILSSISQHVVCFEDDADNLDLALLLRTVLLNRQSSNAPIIVHMEQSSGLAQLLESNHGGPEIPDGLYPFGMLDQILHHEHVLADGLDKLARAFHEAYLVRREDRNVDRRLYSSLFDWVALAEPTRSSNRQSADHLATKLRAIGCAFGTSVDPAFVFSDAEALLLARMEHNRWCSEKISSGWQYGPSRIESAKLNPIIGPWDELDVSEQNTQIEAIKRLPDLVANAGIGFTREYRIGVTGHRLHKLDVESRTLRQDIEEILAKIVSANPGKRFVVYSPLAEGADRLVAEIAMDKFSIEMRVPLPLPYELYQTDFGLPVSNDRFREMVGMAETYFELPMRFGDQKELTSHIDGRANELRNKQYALGGAYLVQHCDELIAVWDGEIEAGTGGTGQIVRWRQAGKPEDEFLLESAFTIRRDVNQPIILIHKYTPAVRQ